MNNPSTQPFAESVGPWKLLVITIVSSFLGFQLLGSFLGFFIAMPFFDGTLMDMANALADPIGNPNFKVPLMIVQGFGSAFGLIFVPWLIYTKIFKFKIEFRQTQFQLQPVLLTFLLVVFFMAVNSPVVEWNQNLKLPSSLAGLEQAMKGMEEEMKVLTDYLTSFDNFGQFLFGILIIAIIPAIGEELVFRGLVQNHLFRITKNIHVAIWLAAFIFGAIHLQFYGMFARMLLGVLFGYLYYYSGSLFYSIFAHFVNNAVAVVAVYMYHKGSFDYNIDSPEALPWYQVLLSLVVFVLLFMAFINVVKPKEQSA